MRKGVTDVTTYNVFQRVVKEYRETHGYFCWWKEGIGQDELIEQLNEFIRQNPNSDRRAAAQALGVAYSTIRKIEKKREHSYPELPPPPWLMNQRRNSQ